MKNEDPAFRYATSRIRVAILLLAIAALADLFLLLIPEFLRGDWRGDMGGDFVVLSLLFTIGPVVGLVFCWFLGLRVLLLASRILHFVFGRGVPVDEWQAAACRSVWAFPYAAGLWAITHVIYCALDPGGWPAGAIYYTIANVLCAFCCAAIFWSWLKLMGRQGRTAFAIAAGIAVWPLALTTFALFVPPSCPPECGCAMGLIIGVIAVGIPIATFASTLVISALLPRSWRTAGVVLLCVSLPLLAAAVSFLPPGRLPDLEFVVLWLANIAAPVAGLLIGYGVGRWLAPRPVRRPTAKREAEE